MNSALSFEAVQLGTAQLSSADLITESYLKALPRTTEPYHGMGTVFEEVALIF